MPVFINRGRFTPDTIKGMLAKPEDRAEAVGQMFEKLGGRLLAYYMTFDEYDFMTITEGPFDEAGTAKAIFSAGGLTDLKTTLAITSSEMKESFAKAGRLAASFKPAGGKN